MYKGGKTQTRVPAWTDRVLAHSLRDRAHRLELSAYELCDALDGSDHRPVAAVARLRVNACATPAAALRPGGGAGSAAPPACARLVFGRGTARASLRSRDEVRAARERLYEGVLAREDTVGDAGDDDDIERGPSAVAAPAQAPGASAPSRSGLADDVGDAEGRVDVEAVRIVFPIASEDPLATERRVNQCADALLGESAAAGSPIHAAGATTHLQNAHTVSWADFVQHGAELFGDAPLALGAHALVSLHGRDGRPLGQGVICPLALEPPVVGADGVVELPIAEVPLSLGGQWRGTLHVGAGLEQLVGITAAAALAEVPSADAPPSAAPVRAAGDAGSL